MAALNRQNEPQNEKINEKVGFLRLMCRGAMVDSGSSSRWSRHGFPECMLQNVLS